VALRIRSVRKMRAGDGSSRTSATCLSGTSPAAPVR
jgi:hypothetical protein